MIDDIVIKTDYPQEPFERRTIDRRQGSADNRICIVASCNINPNWPTSFEPQCIKYSNGVVRLIGLRHGDVVPEPFRPKNKFTSSVSEAAPYGFVSVSSNGDIVTNAQTSVVTFPAPKT